MISIQGRKNKDSKNNMGKNEKLNSKKAGEREGHLKSDNTFS